MNSHKNNSENKKISNIIKFANEKQLPIKYLQKVIQK